MSYTVGIDEAGRGPLAGPVAVGVVRVPHDFDWGLVAGAKDSKQMSESARERMYARMRALRERGDLQYAVGFAGAGVIDSEGIMPAIRYALSAAMLEIRCDVSDIIQLDGALKAPLQFTNQTTIIRGDQTEPIISLASIAAKVERDLLMHDLAFVYPHFGFDRHKGYATDAHKTAIAEYGFCPHHRRTFCI